jgi:hypothetical protein
VSELAQKLLGRVRDHRAARQVAAACRH